MFRKIVSLGAVLALLFVGSIPTLAASSRCEVTDKPRWQCCAKKGSPMPPCCQQGCSTPTLSRP